MTGGHAARFVAMKTRKMASGAEQANHGLGPIEARNFCGRGKRRQTNKASGLPTFSILKRSSLFFKFPPVFRLL
jgi:hypothetical protein